MSEQSHSTTVGADSVPEQVAASRSEFTQPFADLNVSEMTLDQLREMRKVLTERESQISYWRRIIQARLDLLRDGAPQTAPPSRAFSESSPNKWASTTARESSA